MSRALFVTSGKALVVLLFLAGAILNTAAYWSLAPVTVFLIAMLILLGGLWLFDRGGKQERRAALLLMLICFFWAGVSASFLEFFGEENQDPDSTYFHELVKDRTINPIEEAADLRPEEDSFSVWRVAYDTFSVSLLQNAGVILVWRVAYDFFKFLHLGEGRYVGITLNMALVAVSVVLGIKIVRGIFGEDASRIRRFTILCACCGIFWMFGSLHIRDSMALFCVTFLSLFWVRYLADPGRANLALVCAATAVSFVIFGLVRTEFVFVPFAMLLAAIAARLIGARKSGQKRAWLYAILGILTVTFTIGALLAFPRIVESITAMLSAREQAYSEVSAKEGGTASLGNQLIINQVGPVRLLFGSTYLLISPIPFWAGITSSAAYHMFKSFNVIFMYFTLPLFVLGLLRIAKVRALRRPVNLFLVFSYLGFHMSIAYTSLELRHIGAFFILYLTVAVLPNLSEAGDSQMYRFLLTCLMGFIVPLHLTWLLYKLVV